MFVYYFIHLFIYFTQAVHWLQCRGPSFDDISGDVEALVVGT